MSDSELTKPMIVNWALAELGLRPNFSIDEESELGQLVAIFWPRAIAHCFGLSDWTFCRKTYRLTRLVEQPVTGYRNGFEMPRPRLGEPVKFLRDPQSSQPIRDTRIEGETLFCNEDAVWAVCKVDVEPAYWDQLFATCFAVALASYLAVPLLQDLEMAEAKFVTAFGSRSEGGAGGLFGRLIAQNRAAGPVSASILDNDILTAGRHSGLWYGRY